MSEEDREVVARIEGGAVASVWLIAKEGCLSEAQAHEAVRLCTSCLQPGEVDAACDRLGLTGAVDECVRLAVREGALFRHAAAHGWYLPKP